MNNMSNMMDDIEKYAGMWDKALENGVFKDAPKPPERKGSFFGLNQDNSNTSVEDVDTKYWNDVYNQSNYFSGEESEDQMLHEETEPNKEKIKNHAVKMANSHNPQQPEFIGKDQEYFKQNDQLQELTDLKLALEKLEIKMNTDEGNGQATNVQGKIDNLKKQIDDLSDSLNGNRFDR